MRNIPVEVPLGPDDGGVDGSVANLDTVQLVRQRLLDLPKITVVGA